MNTSDNVVMNVRGLMGETGATQAEVGRWLGLSQAAVAKRISSRSVVFNVDELETIAEHFGVPVQSLFDPPRALPFRGRVGAVTPEYGGGSTITAIDWDEIEHYVNEGVYA